MKKLTLIVIILATVGLVGFSFCLHNQQTESAADLSGVQSQLAEVQKENDDLAQQIVTIQKQIETARAELETAQNDLIEAQTAQQEAEAACQQAEADKAAAEAAAKQATAQPPQASPNNSIQKDKEPIGLNGKDFLELIGGGNGGYASIEDWNEEWENFK